MEQNNVKAEGKKLVIANKIEEPPEKNFNDKSKNFRLAIIGFISFLVVVSLVVAIVNIYQVYAKGARSRFTVSVARFLHMPAFKVNGISVPYSDYVDDMKAITVLRDFTRANGGGPAANFSDEQMSDQVLVRLANTVLLKEVARVQGVSVEDKDLEAIKAQMLQQFKNTAEVDQQLKQRYGWNLQTYEEKVMRPFVLQNKVAERVQADSSRREFIRAQAEEVLKKIVAGGDFAALAKQYGQDGTASQGGDLGWFGKGDMVPQFETPVLALKKGEVAKNLIETPYGYHVVQLLDRKTETEKGGAGKKISIEKFQARHILFRFPSLDQDLDVALKRATIHFYLKAHNPFSELKK